jgi:hypothetical protein
MPAIGRSVAKLSGFAPAVPTPLTDDGKVDCDAFEDFCDRQLHAGATALVVDGTTGEAPTLTRDINRSEHMRTRDPAMKQPDFFRNFQSLRMRSHGVRSKLGGKL